MGLWGIVSVAILNLMEWLSETGLDSGIVFIHLKNFTHCIFCFYLRCVCLVAVSIFKYVGYFLMRFQIL